MMLTRRGWLGTVLGGAALALTGETLWGAAPAPAATPITVYKSPTCGCCTKWVEYMRSSGFQVTAHDVADVEAVKRKHGVPDRLASCHTGLVGGYVVEGHVPAEEIRRLLKERPQAVGLAVPGMPMGSPGMEGPTRDRYEVILFDRAGKGSVFARR